MIERLRACLQTCSEIEIAVLVGSRANGTSHAESDWDIAVLLMRASDSLIDELSRLERVRCRLAQELSVIPEKIDLIDLSRARLAMCALVAEDGLVLKGNETARWFHFLQRTWRELEEADWERTHAA